MDNQLTRGQERHVMYIENKDGDIDGVAAPIGWVSFSKSGKSVFYRGHELHRVARRGVRGNYIDGDTGEIFWVSGVKKRGSNVHWAEPASVAIDGDALEEYSAIRAGRFWELSSRRLYLDPYLPAQRRRDID